MTTALAGPCDTVSAAAAEPRATVRPNLTLAATILGSSVAFIDGSVVNVALPALVRDLGAGPSELTWAINAYLLPLGALILLGGALGDHFGRRRLFLAGLALFTLTSIVCASAPTFGWLLAGRGVQGLGAALLMPNSLAILGGAFTGEARGRAIGTWAAVGALAGALAPILGGWLVDVVGWRTIFLLNPPIAAGAAFLAWRFVSESKEARRDAALDSNGAALATAGLGLLTWALTAASAADGVGLGVWLAAGGGVVLLVGFITVERRRGDNAIMPLAIFGAPTFVGLTLLTFFLYGSLGGLLVLLPFLLIRVEHWTAVAAGAALLPVPIVIGLGSRLMGRVTARIGGRLPLAIAAAVVGAGLTLYARIGGGAIDYWTEILPQTLLVALGMGVSVAPLTTTVMASVDIDHVGAASGFNSAVARIAGRVATALLGFVLRAKAHQRISSPVSVSQRSSEICRRCWQRVARFSSSASPPSIAVLMSGLADVGQPELLLHRVNVAENPKLADRVVRDAEKSRAGPGDLASSRFDAEELGPVHAAEPHSSGDTIGRSTMSMIVQV